MIERISFSRSGALWFSISPVSALITADFFLVSVALLSATCRTGIGWPSPTKRRGRLGVGARLGTLAATLPDRSTRIVAGKLDNCA